MREVKSLLKINNTEDGLTYMILLMALSTVIAQGSETKIAADVVAAAGAWETIKGYLPSILTGAGLVALLGYFGVIYKSKMDLRISSNSNVSKFTEAVFNEHAKLRDKNSELEAKLRDETKKTSEFMNSCKILEYQKENLTKELEISKEKVSKKEEEINRICLEKESLEKEVRRLTETNKNSAIRERLKASGLSDTEVDRLMGGTTT